MSEELKLNENVGAPQPDALAQIARKDDFLQQLQEFLAQHKGENWCVAAIDIEHFKLYIELYGSQQAHSLLLSLTALLLEHSKATGSPVGYLGSDDFVLCLPDDKEQQLAIISHLQTCVNDYRQGVTSFLSFGVCPVAEHPDADAQTLCSYAQIASVDPSPAVGGMHRFTPAMLSRLKKQRQLLSELEQTLTEKRDAEHFLRVLAPKYKSVFVVDLKTDRMRGVIVPDYFQKILDTSGGSFLAVLQQYRDTQVQPAYRESLADLLDYNYIRSKVLTGDIVERTYKKTDGTTFRVKVTPYSRSGSHIDETLWIFSDEGASLTPPQTK